MKKFYTNIEALCGLSVAGTTSLSTATGVTVATSDNSTNLATTAFVKAQGYATTTALSGYVPITRTITINGTTLDLSADRTWTIPSSAYTSKLQHQVKAGVAINKGQAVYVTGADGTNMIVGLASNAAEATSSKTMGLLDATVATNGFANVITEGLLDGLDTSTAGSEGDPVWLGTGGNLIYGLINKPSAPAHLVFIGIVTRKNNSNGEIFVKVQNGFELNEIHDVDLKTTVPVNGHILGFDGTLWVNKTIAGWLGYTPANASGTTNYISKFTGSTTLGNSLIYDDGSGVGIGTTSPSSKLSIVGPDNASGLGVLELVTSSTNLKLGGNFDYSWIQSHNSKPLRINELGNNVILNLGGGNVGIGTSSPAQKLDVTDGDFVVRDAADVNKVTLTRFGGIELRGNGTGYRTVGTPNTDALSLATNNTSRVYITSGGNVGIGTTSPTNKLQVANGDMSITSGYSFILADTDTNWRLGRNIISETGNQLTSNTMQFIAANASGQGWQFVDDDGGTRFEIEASTGNAWFNTGNVAIGAISALYKLDIAGAVRLTGSLVFDDTTSNLIQHRAGTDVNTLVTVGHGGFDHNGYLRIGGADVATRAWVQSQGYLTSYTETDTLASVTARGNTTTGSITVLGGMGATETTDGYGLEIMGNYTNGQYNHRLSKFDKNGGVPLYIQFTSGTANVWSNSARFGSYSGNGYEFEVYGAAKVNGDLASTGQINASGGDSSQWNTAYSWGNHASQGYATQTYVNTAIANLVDAAPTTLDTLNELAAALGDDPNFATTVATSIGTKLPLAGGTMTGSINMGGNNITNIGQISVVKTQDTPPSGVNGQLWWESDTGVLKVYYGASSAWVDAVPLADMNLYYLKAGGPISGDVYIGQTLTVAGNILPEGLVDGVDIAAFKAAYDAHNHDGVYVPINPDGDGPSWVYSDANPTINGTYIGGRQSFGADGDALTGGALQARLLNAYDGHVNSAYGYYIGNLNYGGDSGTHTTTQVINSSGAWVGTAIADNKIASSANWNTAYGWGNHASAGYLTTESDTLATVTSRGATTSGSIYVNGDIFMMGTPTTTNQARTIDFTGFDKEGVADFSDRAYIQHTTNTGGHAGSVLVLSSQNDADDGIAFLTNASSQLKHNSNVIWTAGNDGSGSGLDADLFDGQNSSEFLRLLSGGAEASLDSYTDNGFRSVSFTGHSQHLLSWNAGGSTGTIQQLFHYGTPNNGWKIRNKTDNSSWSSWGYVVMSSSNQGLISGTIATQSWVGSQGYITGNQTITLSGDVSGSGTTSISVTVNNIDGWGFVNTGSNSATNADNINSNGISYYTAGVTNFSGNATDGALYSQRYSDYWQHQIAGDYRSGMIAVRGKNNGTWTSWKTIIDSSTIGSQSVSYATTAGALTSMNISQFTNNSGYIAAGSTVSETAVWTGATKFRSAGDISQTGAGNHALQIFSDDGNDAFMAFHISADHAVYFGLENSTNRLYTGGWSDGANKYQIWDSRDFSSTNISNWNTAYNWGNHAGLYLGINSKAADSELLDGVDESRFVYGNSNTRRGTNLISNWNQTDYPDVAFLSAEAGGSNAPNGDYTYGLQYSFHRSGAAYRTQFVTSLYSDLDIWVRNSRDSDVWTSWKKLWHSGNLTNLNQLTNGPGYITGYTETDTLATVTGRGASTSTAVSLSGGATISGITNNGNLVNNGKIVVQNYTNGTNARGIFMWADADSNWGIYMATSASGVSLAGGNSVASIDGRTSHHIRFRAYNATGNGFIWENDSEQCVMSLTTDSGNLYTRGQIYAGNNTSNVVWHAGNDGSGSGLDADTLDGLHASSFLTAESDTLQTVTNRGATTTNPVFINSGAGYPLRVSSGQRYMMQIRNTANTIDTNYGWWWFMDTDFNMGFHADGAGDKFTLTRSGDATASSSFRAPIFYDSQDTNYYVDPNSTSRLVQLNLGTPNTQIKSIDGVGYLRIYGSASNYLAVGPYDNNGWVYFENSGNASGIYFNTPGRYAFDNADVTPYTDAENSLGAPSYRWSQVYTSGWLRQYGAQGMYNQDYGTHFYSNGGGSWAVTGSGGNIELQFRSNHQSTLRGYVYADTGNNIGFLNNGGSWSFRTTYDRNAYLYGSDLTIGEGGAGATNIIMKDGDEGDRVIHCNSNRIGFLTQSGSWGAYLDDSTNWFAVGSVQAPIFYDSDNTAYYLDPNSNSVLSTAQIAAGLTDNGNTRIYMPGGAWSVNSGGGTGGAIKISLPTAMYGVNTMMSMTVQVYEYSTGQSFTIRLGGYNYYNHEWYNVFAYMVNDSGKSNNVPVYFGNDGTRDVIWLGEPGWSWSYPNVFVTDFQAGHTQYAGWRTGWSVSFDTGSRTNVSASRTAYRQIDTGNYNSYSPTLTGGGASGTWGISISGNAATATSATSATTATTSSNVTVNSGNTSAAWYPIVWHSGNTLYSSSGAEIYAAGNYIRCQYINTSDNDETGITRFVIKNGDNYHRSATTTTAANVIRDVASGSWGISITGNAATASSASSATNLYGPGGSYIKSSSTGTSYTANYQIRENDGGGNNTNEIYAPQLAFHWSGVVASSIMLEASGRIAIRNNPGGAYEAFMAGIIYSSGYGDSTQWNTAYSWGNHASAGYVTSAGSVASATSATQVVTIQDTPPAGVNGKLWWESDTGKLKVYYGSSSAWVDASPIPDMSIYYAKAGGPITGDVTIQQTLTVVGNTLIQGILTETSDISLKENILPLENSLEKVMQLNGVSFNKIETPELKEIGFIAQEVEAVIPELVTETEDGIKTVSYSRVTAVLVETVKQQQAQIDELKELVNKLTQKLNTI